MSKHGTRVPGQRQLRVGEEVRHVLAAVLGRDDVRDPDVRGVPVTVTEVRISPDLKNATAFVVPLGGATPDDLEKVIVGLNRAVPYLRKVIAEGVHLRNVPRLNFIADRTFDEVDRIDRLLRHPSVARDLAGPALQEESVLQKDNAMQADDDGA